MRDMKKLMTKKTLLVSILILSVLLGGCQNGTPESAEVVQLPDSTPGLNPTETAVVTATPKPGGVFVPITQTTPTPLPPPHATPLPSPTPKVPPMPLPTPSDPLVQRYTVQAGDTLGGISYAFDVSMDELLAMNGFESDSAIINVGQTVLVPLELEKSADAISLLPDSEVVFGPAYTQFDVTEFVQKQGGYLANYSETVNGIPLSGADIVDHLARQYSVGPRVLLALLEYYGGWVTQLQPPAAYPMGIANPYGERLYLQMSWVASRVNMGYYDYKRAGVVAVRFRDWNRALIPAGSNAGTAGIENLLALNADNFEDWQNDVSAAGFIKTYRQLFGDPFGYAVEPLVPATLTQPDLQLPWQSGETFYYTGGPHPAYGTGSAWAAIDFGPPDVLGSCYYSDKPIVAAADGRIFLGSKGENYLDLDGDGNLQTGWVLLYLHVVADDALTQGQYVSAGTPLGYASCEGGSADASHLHFARRYNGEWMAADGAVPMVLSGWTVKKGVGEYEGSMVKADETKVACECWDESNALVAP